MTPLVVDWMGVVSLDANGQRPVALLHSSNVDDTTRIEQWLLFDDTSDLATTVQFVGAGGTSSMIVPARRPYPEQLPGARGPDPLVATTTYFQRHGQPSQLGVSAGKFLDGLRVTFAGVPHRYVWARVKVAPLTPTAPAPDAELLQAPSPGAPARARGWQQRQYAVAAQTPGDAACLWAYGEWSAPASGFAAQRVHVAWRSDASVTGPTLATNALVSPTPGSPDLKGWLTACRARLGVTQASPARYALAQVRVYPTIPAALPS